MAGKPIQKQDDKTHPKKRLTVWLDEEMYRGIRQEAVDREVSLSYLIDEAIRTRTRMIRKPENTPG